MNLQRINRIGKLISDTEPDVVPFAPYMFPIAFLNDSILEERRKGMAYNEAILRSGMITELRLYGGHITDGMRAEIQLAKDHNIPVRSMTMGTEHWEEIT